MNQLHILIGTKSKSIIATMRKISVDQAINVRTEQTLEDFLLNVQQEDLQAILFDTRLIRGDVIKMIRLIRRMRPKVPLIVLPDKIDKKLAGQIFNEGVLQIIVSPNKTNFVATLNAVLKTKN